MHQDFHLSKAPLKEALIDIQGVFTEAKTREEILGSFEKGYAEKNIKTHFPKVEKRFEQQIMVDPSAVHQISNQQVGFMFRSASDTEVMQYRLNGFSFSILKDYTSWTNIFEKTKVNFKTFKEIRSDFAINRIAARYINEIKVPYPFDMSGNDYISKSQSIPTGSKEVTVFSLAEQMKWYDTKSGFYVNLIKVLAEPPPDAVETNLIVDIDIFRNINEMPISEQVLWEQINQFKDAKNDIFFSIVGKKTIERYK